MRRFATILLPVALLLAGCTEPFDVELETIDELVVIEGFVLDTATTHTVLATRTQPFGASQPAPRVTGGVGNIRNVGTGTVHPLTENMPGIYQAVFTAAVGDIYALTLTLDGVTYTAIDTLKRVSQLDSVTYQFEEAGPLIEEEGYYLTTYDTELAGKGDFREYRFFLNGEPYDYTLENILTFQDLRVDGNPIIADWAGVFPYAIGDTFAVELRGISLNAFNYLRDLQASANSGNPFAGPPFTPRTNITGGEALGFFMCQSVSRLEGVIQ